MLFLVYQYTLRLRLSDIDYADCGLLHLISSWNNALECFLSVQKITLLLHLNFSTYNLVFLTGRCMHHLFHLFRAFFSYLFSAREDWSDRAKKSPLCKALWEVIQVLLKEEETVKIRNLKGISIFFSIFFLYFCQMHTDAQKEKVKALI